MPVVQGPDGRPFSFPDDATRQEILATMQRYYAAEEAKKNAELDRTERGLEVGQTIASALSGPAGLAANTARQYLKSRAKSGQAEQDFARDEGWLDRSGSLLERGYQSGIGGMSRVVGTVTGSETAKRSARESERIANTEIEGTTSWEDAKKGGIGDYVKFGTETAIQSLPEMALTAIPYVGLGAEAVVQTGRIAQQRAQADNRYEASGADILTAAPFGVASAALEKTGVDAVLGKVASKYGGRIANNVLGRVGIGAASEAATEFLQSGVEYAGGSLGTKEGFDPVEAIDQMAAGAVGGGIAGGVLSTTVETGKKVYGLTSKPKPRGEIESSADLTPEDQASPLPNDLLADGLKEVRGTEAKSRADAILQQAGMPTTGAQVAITIGGETVIGTVEDAYTGEDGAAGVQIALPDGSVFKEYIDDIRDDPETDVRPLNAEEINALAEQEAQASRDRADAVIAELAAQDVGGEPETEPQAVEIPGAIQAVPGERQPQGSVQTSMDAFKRLTRRAESGGNDRAKNPRSSAAGRYQFTDGTWIATYRAEFNTNETDAQILAKKFDGDLQERLMDRLTRDNARGLQEAGIAVNPTSLYVAHFAGIYGAKKLYKANPGAPVEQVLGEGVVKANPFLRGMSASEAIADLGRRIGDKANARLAVARGETASVTEQDTTDPWAEALERYREDTRDQVEAEAPLSSTELQATDESPIVAPEAAAEGISSPLEQADYGGTPQEAGGAPAESLPSLSQGNAISVNLADTQGKVPTFKTNKISITVGNIGAEQVASINAALPEGVSLKERANGTYSAPVRYESAVKQALATTQQAAPQAPQSASVPSPEIQTAPGAKRTGAPVDMLKFVARNGGVSYDGLNETTRNQVDGSRGHDLKNTGSLDKFVPGAGPLLRPNGKSLDEIGELLWDAGYFGPPEVTPRPSEDDVIQALDRASRGERVYSTFDQAPAPKPATTQPEEEWTAEREEAAKGMAIWEAWDEAARDLGKVTFTPSEIERIRRSAAETGVEPIADDETDPEKIKTYVIETANRELDDARQDAFFEVEDELYADIEEQFRAERDRADAAEGADRGTGEQGPAPDTRDAGEEPQGRRDGQDGAQDDGTGLDLGEAVDPAVAERQRTETQLRAEAPLRGSNRTGQEQDGTMGLGLFDATDQPQMDLAPKSKLRTLVDGKKPDAQPASPQQTEPEAVNPDDGEGTPIEIDGEQFYYIREGDQTRLWNKTFNRLINGSPNEARLREIAREARAQDAEQFRRVASARQDDSPTSVFNRNPEQAIANLSDEQMGMFAQALGKKWRQGQSRERLIDQFGIADLRNAYRDVVANQTTEPQQTATPEPEASAQSNDGQAIDDFGEKLEGARKDLWKAYADRLQTAKQEDVQSVPLSKSWPEPDYQKLIDEGADPYTVASMRAIRDAIPTKPRSYGVVAWGKQVEALRAYAEGLLNGDIDAEQQRKRLEGDFARSLRDMQGSIDLYMEFGHERSFKGITFRSNHYSLYRGERDVTKWAIEQKAKATAFSNWPRELAVGDTREEVIAKFAMMLANGGLDTKKKSDIVRFDIYSRRSEPGKFWIGKKIGKDYADLKSFPTAKEARDYKISEEGYAELVRMLESYKDIPPERKETNSPRIGINHRNGTDVTPDQFMEAFGFRGVQFGNYVEGPRRQADLNEAYDALMDLAGVLNVPAKALSLNGTLGLAFGARGKGGKGAASAHFERGEIVINLTKRSGAGSLAHEWWHSLDNYFSRSRNDPLSMLTEKPYERGEGVRPEMVQAFANVIAAIKATSLRERSKNLDKRRTKQYWSTDVEMSARVFENYVIAKLADEQHSNDYLANIVSEEAFRLDEGYPYLRAGEIAPVRAAFDEFFQTVETKETNAGIALYSIPEGQTIDVDGTDRPRVNADGKPIADTDEKLRNFWRWFGDSRVVDDQGRPIQLWHGTDRTIDAFNGMAWGATDINLAREYALMRQQMSGGTANMFSVYMRAENIFDADNLPKSVTVGSFFNEALEQANAAGQDVDIARARELLDQIRSAAQREESGPNYDRHDFWNESWMRFGQDGAEAINEMFRILGFDGVQMRESATYGQRGEPTFGVFSPNQVKSASENTGAFDPADPRIRYGLVNDLFSDGEMVDPAILEKQRQMLDLRAKSPLRGRSEQQGAGDLPMFAATNQGSLDFAAAVSADPIALEYALAEALADAGIEAVSRYNGQTDREAFMIGAERALGAERRGVTSFHDKTIQKAGERWARRNLLEQDGSLKALKFFDDAFFADMEAGRLSRPARNWRRIIAEPHQNLDLPALQKRLEEVGLSRKASVALVDSLGGAAGVYENALIRIATDTAQDQGFTLNHEIVHALRDFGMISKADWAIMSARARRETALMRSIKQRYEGPLRKQGLKGAALAEALEEEAVADLFAKWQRGDFEAKGTVARMFQRIRDMLEAIGNWVRGSGLRTAGDVIGDVNAGRMREGQRGTGARKDMVVYHGSPHDFDAFSMDAIGSGEGAQAYGAGLYFAGKKDVAEYYRDALGARQYAITVNGDRFDAGGNTSHSDRTALQRAVVRVAQSLDEWTENFKSTDGALGHALNHARASLRSAELGSVTAFQREGGWGDTEKLAEVVKIIEGWQDKDVQRVKGRLYEVDIPEDGEYLLWDAPLSEQPAKVREGIDGSEALSTLVEDLEYDTRIKATQLDQEPTGRDLYQWLSRRSAILQDREATRNDAAASAALKEAGIAGIKYLDGGSRSAGDGSYNYVLFDDSAAKVLAKYSIPEALPDAGHNFDNPQAEVRESSRAMLATLPSGNLEKIQEATDSWRLYVQDEMLPVRRLQDFAARVLGRKLADSENPYLNEEMMTGKAGARLERLSSDIIDPLFQAMHKTNVSIEGLETYLYARHAKERNAQIAKINPEFGPGEGSGMTDTQARAILARIDKAGQTKTMEALASYVDTMLKESVETRVEAGLLSREEADAWAETYKYYVPLRGKKEVDGDVDAIAGRINTMSGKSVRGKESKRAFGRRSEADNILAYSILQAEEAIIRAEKNRVARAFLKLARAMPDVGIWLINKVERRRRINPTTGLVETYVTHNLSEAEQKMTITAKEGGVEYRVTMNRDNEMARLAAEAMRNLENPYFNKVMELSSWFSRGFSAINTRYNPAFVIKNALRDIQTMAVVSQQFDIDGFATRVMSDYKQAMLADTWLGNATTSDAKAEEWAKWKEEWQNAGGKIYYNEKGDIAHIRRGLELRSKRLASGNMAAKAWVKAFDYIEAMNESVERAIRLSVYKNAREMGRSKLQAASMSRNITVNFTRKGRWSPAINILYPFFNASVQGNFNLVRAAIKSSRVRKAMGGFIIAGFLSDMLNSMLSGDDDDGESYWDKMPDWEKSTNAVLFVPGGDSGDAFKMPLGFGLNALFGLGRNLSAMMRGALSPQEAASQSALEWVDAFNPMGSGGSWTNVVAPFFVDPFIDTTVTNRDFTGKPIQPPQSPYEPDVTPSSNYYGNASTWAKTVAKGLNAATGGDDVVPGAVSISPDVIEYFGGYVTGGMGRFAMDIGKLLAAPFDPEADLTVRDVPFAKSVYTTKSPSIDKNIYYERKQEVDAVVNHAKQYAERQDRAGFDRYVDENREVLQMRDVTKDAAKMMSQIRKQKNEASFQYELGNIDKAQYSAVVDRVREAEAKIVTAYNRRWNEVVEAD